MKKTLYLLLALMVAPVFASSCGDDDDAVSIEEYQHWYDANVAWLKTEAAKTNEDGTPFYEEVRPVWAPGQVIWVHWFNDRAETADAETPLATSTVTTRYRGYLYDGYMFDSSVENPNGEINARVSSLITGWQIALQHMHVGDTVQVLIPYDLAYGESGNGSISPYSALRFNMRLSAIPCLLDRP